MDLWVFKAGKDQIKDTVDRLPVPPPDRQRPGDTDIRQHFLRKLGNRLRISPKEFLKMIGCM